MFHIGWQRVDATLIDQKFVRRDSWNVKTRIYYQVWDYMVELPGIDGSPTRLVIREKTYRLQLPDLGGTVPVLVNKKRTKAAFDLKDPRINADAARKANAAAERATDEARFETKLQETQSESSN